jgi:hypothetical protein
MNGYTLNITSFSYSNKLDLITQITRAVKDTQRVLVRDLPNTITMNKQQFKMLKHDSDMLNSQSDNLFRTQYNVMEVIVI